MEEQYKYDAFISYRHLPFDKAVAERLQTLLESYRPPKGVAAPKRTRRIFRDQSELPTSGDLNADLYEALRQSRYLVVVCSEETKNSKWCAREIEYFKELHGGKCGNILTVLISGEPSEAFPPSLRFETTKTVASDGTAISGEMEIEPLAANITADTQSKSFRLLKTEFLRIAAPILSCSYDDLFKRHQRRRTRRIIGASAFLTTAMLIITLTIGMFERQSRNATALMYYRQGIESMKGGNDYPLAMMYFASSLSLNPDDTSAQSAALALLMQNRMWPYVASSGNGRIVNDTLLLPNSERDSISESSAVYISDNIPLADIRAFDSESETILIGWPGCYYVIDINGDVLDIIEEDFDFQSSFNCFASNGCFIFADENSIYIYSVEHKELLVFERPREINPKCFLDYSQAPDAVPPVSVAAYDGGKRAALVCGGYLYFYEWDGTRLAQVKKHDLDEEFRSTSSQEQYLNLSMQLFMDKNEKILAIENLRSVCFVALNRREPLFMHTQASFMVSDVTFSEDSSMLAIAYGSRQTLGFEHGGHAEIYSLSGKLIYSTDELYSEPISQIRFSADMNEFMTYSFTRKLRVWDLSAQTPTETCNPISFDSFEQNAVFCDDNILAIAGHNGNVNMYAALKPSQTVVAGLNNKGYSILSTIPLNDNELALITIKNIFTLDIKSGKIIETIGSDSPQYEDFLISHTLELQNSILLDRTEASLRGRLLDKLSEDVFSRDDIYILPGSFLDQMLVYEGAKNTYVYAIGSITPYFAVYELNKSDNSLNLTELSLLNNDVPAGLFLSSDGKYVAFSTDTNEMWLYKRDALKAPYTTISLGNLGKVEEIAIDPSGTFLAVSLKRYDENGVFDKYSLMEIWDIATKTMLAEITDNESDIKGLRFLNDYLYYGMDDELHRLWLPVKAPGKDRVSFFRELSGYELDAGLTPTRRNALLTDDAQSIDDEWAKLFSFVYDYN